MTDLAKVAADRGIKYFLISFVDLFGTMRAKLVPAAAIDDMAKTGAGFAGFASWLDMTPADPDMFAVPDPDSLIQLPWKQGGGLARRRALHERQAGRAGAPQRPEDRHRQGRREGLRAEDRRRVRILPHHAGWQRASPIPAIISRSPATTSRR